MRVRLAAVLLLCCPMMGWAQAVVPAGNYDIDAGRSEILLYTGRGGWLSALGHRHVLVVTQLSGRLVMAADPTQSSAQLTIPVSAIAIDAPERRAAAGEEFDSVPSAQDIAGTRVNMLASGQLDAATYPTIQVRITVAAWQPPDATLMATLSVVGNSTTLEVPATVEFDGRTLIVSGDLKFRQTALGIEPFQALGGALQVADVVEARFRIEFVSPVDINADYFRHTPQGLSSDRPINNRVVH